MWQPLKDMLERNLGAEDAAEIIASVESDTGKDGHGLRAILKTIQTEHDECLARDVADMAYRDGLAFAIRVIEQVLT